MQPIFKKTTILSATTAIAFLFAGCGESKVAQCNKIVKVSNQAVTAGQEFGNNPQPKKGSKALTEAANKIEQITKDMQALEIKDEKLQGYQGRFLKLYENTSKGLKDTAAALDKKNLAEANRSLASLKKGSSEEAALVKEINSYCSGK
ncbi:hypothetical protein [Calothrix sp. PCC 7507]|uniref:hypothetical protein n=1 Tax=Calothrix sp. PCC 7507 TaxID=99598 RepID=UPI00029EDAE7|nr:hypothetical protein [Calothrix sp. PCC 7507]AFY32710.1 hypothetical protein Cal7507_2275 [Calothrix sp. PCC 7507]